MTRKLVSGAGFAILAALAVFTPLLSQAVYLRMEVTDAAILELLTVAGALGVAFGLAAAVGGRGARTLLAALLLFYFVDGALGWRSLLIDREFPSGLGYFRTEGVAFYGCVAAAFGLSWLIFRFGRDTALFAFSAFVAVAFVVTAVQYAVSPGPPDVDAGRRAGATERTTEQPILIQIIGDALIALRGVPDDVPEAGAFKQLVEDFHRKHDFHLFSRAYTTSQSTDISLSRLMNYSLGQTPHEEFLSQSRLTKNRHFDQLVDWGYRVLVYQRDWPSFCGHDGVDYCLQFRSRASPGVLAHLRRTARPEHRPLIALTLIAHPRSLLQDAAAAYAPLRFMDAEASNSVLNIVGVTQPLESLLAVRTLFEDASRAPDGTALVGHFIVPHFPYSLNESCNSYDGPPHYVAPGTLQPNTEESRLRAYRGYIAQASCLYRTLDDILSDPAHAPLLGRATIIFHGDHGPGITIGNPAMPETMSARDLISKNATHFSVRYPGGRFAMDDRDVSVHRLFYETIDPDVGPWETDEASHSTRATLGIPPF